MKGWKSIVTWPEGTVCLATTDNTSEDTHHSEEEALHVCKMLREHGMGGDGKIFPVKTQVEPLTAEDEREERMRQVDAVMEERHDRTTSGDLILRLGAMCMMHADTDMFPRSEPLPGIDHTHNEEFAAKMRAERQARKAAAFAKRNKG